MTTFFHDDRGAAGAMTRIRLWIFHAVQCKGVQEWPLEQR